MNKDKTVEMILLTCKIENKKTMHTVDGLMIKGDCPDQYKDIYQYTCTNCHGTFYYKKGKEPR